jgi:hypothetical protein
MRNTDDPKDESLSPDAPVSTIEWDPDAAENNWRRYGVRFEEAAMLLDSMEAIELPRGSAPETADVDLAGPRRPNRYARKPGARTEILVDGAVGYSLRLIPSGKILGRYSSTLEAWAAIIAAVESGRSPRTLALDWHSADGRRGILSAGPRLARWARHNNGERVAE